MKLTFKNILHNSNEYWKSVELRDQVLRKPLGLAFTEEELNLEYKQFHFACFLNEQIIGCFIFNKSTENKLKMRQVCIKNEYHKKGIGFKMMLFAEKWAKENHYNEIYCHARNNALAFYQNLNYQIEGDYFEEVGLKHYKLVKSLQNRY